LDKCEGRTPYALAITMGVVLSGLAYRMLGHEQ